MSIKKPIWLGLIVGLLGLLTALPAMAQAAPSLKSGGMNLAIGAKVVATSTNTITETNLGTLECALVTIEGEVTVNPGATLEHGSGSATTCSVSGFKVEVKSIAVPKVQFNEGGTDTASMEFAYDIPEPGITGCHLGSASVGSTWTNGSSIDQIGPSLITGGGGSTSCPKEGTLSGTFELKTPTGGAVTVNN